MAVGRMSQSSLSMNRGKDEQAAYLAGGVLAPSLGIHRNQHL